MGTDTDTSQSQHADLLYREFVRIFTTLFPEKAETIAVALSGGPDSMALLWLLHDWAEHHHCRIHALHVDHGLRPESDKNAQILQNRLEQAGLSYVTFVPLKRRPTDTSRKIQEQARTDRYALMAEYCKEHGIRHLCLAHHRDDQAETILFRLAKGSGLDGLSGMQETSAYNKDLTLLRPLLGHDKQELVDFCRDRNIPYLIDPSNENTQFARVRLRQSADILAREGLTAKRLSTTARRLARAKEALDFYADNLFETACTRHSAIQLVFDRNTVNAAPAEIRLRLLQKAIAILAPGSPYGPRMEKLEQLEQRIFTEQGFQKATLGGCVFSLQDKKASLVIETEKLDKKN